MIPTISDLTIDLHANVASLRADLGKATNETQKFASQVKGAFSSLRNIVGALGLTVGVQQIVSFAKGAFDAAAGISELAKQLGLSASALQELQFAARQSGVSSGELESAFARLTRSIGDAASGSKSAVEAFNRMGVAFIDNTGKARSNEAVFRDIAEAYQNSADKTKFAADMSDVLGRSATRLIPILENGADGLDRNAEKARELGQVLSDDLVNAADEAADALDTLFRRLTNNFTTNSYHLLQWLGVVDRTRKQAIRMQIGQLDAQRNSLKSLLSDPGQRILAGRSAAPSEQERFDLLNQIADLTGKIEILNKELSDINAAPVPPPNLLPGGSGSSGSSGSGSTKTPDWLKDIREILADDSWKDKQYGIVEYSKIVDEAADETMQLGSAVSGMTNDLIAAARGTMDFRDVFLNSLNDILAGIAEGLMNLSSGGKSSMGGIGGIISGIIGIAGSAFGGGGLMADPFPGTTGRAGGGPVDSGHTYRWQERGDEYFIPGDDGWVVRGDQMGSGGGTYYIDARGADRAGMSRLERMIRAINGSIEPRALATVSDQRRRGGLPAFR